MTSSYTPTPFPPGQNFVNPYFVWNDIVSHFITDEIVEYEETLKTLMDFHEILLTYPLMVQLQPYIKGP